MKADRSYFSTRECSNPEFESDGLRFVTVNSPALNGRCDIRLAMPPDGLIGHRSGYLPRENGDYETWIVNDVPPAARTTEPTATEQSPLFIPGLSIGGFGVMRVCVKYRGLLRTISEHSSVTDVVQLDELFTAGTLDGGCWSEIPEATVTHWIKINREQLHPLRFDCGRDDHPIEPNRKLHADIEVLDPPPHTPARSLTVPAPGNTGAYISRTHCGFSTST